MIGFCFGTQDTIEGVSVFRIDSHTIKREKWWLHSYRVPLGEFIFAYALGPSVLTSNFWKCFENMLTHVHNYDTQFFSTWEQGWRDSSWKGWVLIDQTLGLVGPGPERVSPVANPSQRALLLFGPDPAEGRV
jgi:hypothetical protein